MGNLVIGRLLRWLGGRLDGYKTTIGGVGMILSGLAGLIGYMFPDNPNLPKMEINDVLLTITGGFAVLGIGGKLDKTRGEISTGRPSDAKPD
jgi:hypothetical protein